MLLQLYICFNKNHALLAGARMLIKRIYTTGTPAKLTH